jgi:hypothetical protein
MVATSAIPPSTSFWSNFVPFKAQESSSNPRIASLILWSIKDKSDKLTHAFALIRIVGIPGHCHFVQVDVPSMGVYDY